MAKRKTIPARSPEARENQLINLAVDEVEKRLRDGTVSSQLLALLLKLGTTRAKFELEKLKADVSLQKAKEQEIEDKASNADLYAKALRAFRVYKGEDPEEYDDYE